MFKYKWLIIEWNTICETRIANDVTVFDGWEKKRTWQKLNVNSQAMWRDSKSKIVKSLQINVSYVKQLTDYNSC